MIRYAENELELGQALSDGATLRDHLENQFRQKRMLDPSCATPDELVPVEVEECVLYLWDYFRSMNLRRTSNGFGKNPISELELAAWCDRRGIRLAPFECDALDALEAVYQKYQHEQLKKQNG